jgi:hypothetical protein
MSHFQLIENLYITPTPGGAYYGTSRPEQNPSRHLLQQLLKGDLSPLLSIDALKEWTGETDVEQALELLYHAQKIGWVEGYENAQKAPKDSLEEVLPELLPLLSGKGKALLADSQGFYISSQGFPHDTAEELSALSADLASLNERHQRLLTNNIHMSSSAWGVVDTAGNSQIGFWPLYISTQRFVLVIAGMPRLNQAALKKLIWALMKRYGS